MKWLSVHFLCLAHCITAWAVQLSEFAGSCALLLPAAVICCCRAHMDIITCLAACPIDPAHIFISGEVPWPARMLPHTAWSISLFVHSTLCAISLILTNPSYASYWFCGR